jgi:hypothetical protein
LLAVDRVFELSEQIIGRPGFGLKRKIAAVQAKADPIRKAAITAVARIIAELQSCGHAVPDMPDLSLDHLEAFQQLLAQLERGPRNA